MQRGFVALLVQPKYFDILNNIVDPSEPEGLQELGEILQLTLQLEHATIPPYLTAAYSLKGIYNRSISELILRIAKEEMLHMTVIANIMNAIGVSPKLNDPEFIPAYPAPLPLLDTDGWQVGLKSFSKDIDASKALIKDTFMRIEAPEDPLMFPDLDDGAFLASAVSLGEAPRTIGALYESIISVFESGAIPNLFSNTENTLYKQVTTEGLLRFRFRPVQLKKDPLKSIPCLMESRSRSQIRTPRFAIYGGSWNRGRERIRSLRMRAVFLPITIGSSPLSMRNT
jgi:rubrerythrin